MDSKKTELELITVPEVTGAAYTLEEWVDIYKENLESIAFVEKENEAILDVLKSKGVDITPLNKREENDKLV